MEPIPITILGGSDRKRSRLPEAGRRLHPLAAYKGAALYMDGLPLALVLAKRLIASGGFLPVTIAGPARIYKPLIDELWREDAPLRVIDTDSTVAHNLRRAVLDHEARHDSPLAVLACDVLPSVEELRELRSEFERVRPVALWLPLIASPSDPKELGAFAWKPKYRVLPVMRGDKAIPILPGHLAILKPARLRLGLALSLMDAAYRTRNRPVASRRWAMLWRVSGSLLWADLLQLLRLRPPTRTLSVVLGGLRISNALRAKELDARDLERMLTDAFVRQLWRKLERPVQLPVLDYLSLAEDIDTEEEARALSTELVEKNE